MNTFEVAAILTPLTGLLAGITVGCGGGGGQVFFRAATGLLSAFAIYPGPLFLVQALVTTLGLPDGRDSVPSTPWWLWTLLCYVIASPGIALIVSGRVVLWLLVHL